MSRTQSLHYTSGYPRSLIKSIPYSQDLHLEKICAETLELSKNLEVLKESFINRGFNEKILDTEFQRLSEIKSDALLTPKSKENDQWGFLEWGHFDKRFMCDTQKKDPAGKNFGPFYPRSS